MTVALTVGHVLLFLLLPFVLSGLINRTKAWWAGRRGPPLLQGAYDLARLLRKRPVYSEVTTLPFRHGAFVTLAATVAACAFSPLLGRFAPLQFSFDFVAFAYVLGLGRVFMMLSAMDTGSSFEGMGASREATFAVLAESSLFLLIGACSIATGHTSFAEVIGTLSASPHFLWLVFPASVALLILLQTEAARVPVDDPLTHLELTMIHEVMILDASGPELAAVQYAASLKLTLHLGLFAALLNPYDIYTSTARSLVASIAIMFGVAVIVGTVESLVARLRMRWVPRYVLTAVLAAGVCLVLAVWTGRSS